MKRPVTFFVGSAVLLVGLVLRCNLIPCFFDGHLAWSGTDFEASFTAIRLNALADVCNIVSVGGLAVALIGWFYPPSNDHAA